MKFNKAIKFKTTVKSTLSDLFTPIGIYLRLRDQFRDTILLESAGNQNTDNNFSFIAVNAVAGIEIRNYTEAQIKFPLESAESINIENEKLTDLLQDFSKVFECEAPSMPIGKAAQGFFGYTSYDAVPFFEHITFKELSPENNIPLMRYRLYQYVIAINHHNDEMFLIENKIEGLKSEMSVIENLIQQKNAPVFPFAKIGEEESNLTDEEYRNSVETAKKHCFRGDVFQLVLSRRFQQKFRGDEFNVYRALRNINPSPYLFFFDYGDYKLMGSSPESQLIIKNNQAVIHPIAGTFKRTGNIEEDLKAAEELKKDAKENAEHTMLVDLARNDLIVNPQVKDVFVKRTKLFNAMRTFFNDAGYFEVETPILQSIPGGAAAKPFITHHNALDIPLYLRIANELYLKRLIVGGFDGVYEFSKNFRNEGMDRTHNPEFTALEIYVAYKDYNWMMDFTEKLLEYCAVQVNGSTNATFGEHQIDFKAPYPRISMTEAILNFTGFDITGKSESELFDFAKSIGIDVNETMGKGKLIDEIFGEKCEGNFIQPTFITDYPIEMSPLTKKHRSKEGLTERFELMVCGKEVANAYSELNDPIDQRERFEAQAALSERGDDEAMFIDNDFLRALEYGMPPTSGLGIGMDRLIMFLTNNPSIQEILFFPQMKPEKTVPQIELGEDEKAILEILNSQEEAFLLNELKERSQLSGKKWDKATKNLTKFEMIKVTKTDENVFVNLI